MAIVVLNLKKMKTGQFLPILAKEHISEWAAESDKVGCFSGSEEVEFST